MENTESTSSSSMCSFQDWVLLNGGDTELVEVLKENGFSSKLSLKKMEFDCPEGEQLLRGLTYGKQCLLKALVEALHSESLMASSESRDHNSTMTYTRGATKAISLASGGNTQAGTSIKDKIGKLFHFHTPGSVTPSISKHNPLSLSRANDDDDFQPVAMTSTRYKGTKRSMKRRNGDILLKGPVKRKVKQIILPVVGLNKVCYRTPTGAARSKLTRDIWLNSGSSEEIVRSKIAETFEWEDASNIQFLFAQGRNLRKASLTDVENSSCWDLETVKVLMGSGALYVVRPQTISDEMLANIYDVSNDHAEALKNYAPQTCGIEDKNRSINDDVILKEMFPNKLSECIEEAPIVCGSVTEAVDISSNPARQCPTNEQIIVSSSDDDLPSFSAVMKKPARNTVDNRESSSNSPDNHCDRDTDLQILLNQHSSKVLDTFSEFCLTVDRSSPEHFWVSVVAFYKGAIRNPDKLKRSLIVTFDNSGEDGYDAGALRKEFFEDSLKAVNERLFEGDEKRRIPKKDCSLEIVLEVAGMIFAHSVLQEGPAMPCLSSFIFEYLLHGDTSRCHPLKEDIPLNMSTCELIMAIEELDKADTDEEVDAVLETQSVMAIINHSRWSITESITKSNKSALLQQLIWEEVIIRREHNMKAFRRGMRILGIVDLLQRHPLLTRPLLVAEDDVVFTSQKFISLISSSKPVQLDECQAYERFIEFVSYIENQSLPVSLSSLLKFITGTSSIPPMGLSNPIQLSYYSKSSGKRLPGSAACVNKLFLPTLHSEKEDFFSDLVKGIEFGGGFGLP